MTQRSAEVLLHKGLVVSLLRWRTEKTWQGEHTGPIHVHRHCPARLGLTSPIQRATGKLSRIWREAGEMTQELGNESHSREFKQCYLLRCTKNMYFDLQLYVFIGRE